MKQVIAGIDIGGTKISLALAAANCEVLTKCSFPTRVEEGPYKIVERTLDKLETLLEQENAELIAIGVGCPGPIDIKRGMTLSPPKLPGWDEFPVVEIIGKRFKALIAFDNDANTAAFAEHQFGAGRGFNNLIYLTISTGIGGGVIVDGKLVHGISGNAGEIGHIVVKPNGFRCGCGALGCLETICSGTAIARRTCERIQSGVESSIIKKVESLQQITAKMVAEAALEGDGLAVEIWSETISYLSLGLGNILVTLEPEAIILGGGVAMTGEQLLAPLREQVYSQIKILDSRKIKILQAKLLAESGVYGALALAATMLVDSPKTVLSG